MYGVSPLSFMHSLSRIAVHNIFQVGSRARVGLLLCRGTYCWGFSVYWAVALLGHGRLAMRHSETGASLAWDLLMTHHPMISRRIFSLPPFAPMLIVNPVLDPTDAAYGCEVNNGILWVPPWRIFFLVMSVPVPGTKCGRRCMSQYCVVYCWHLDERCLHVTSDTNLLKTVYRWRLARYSLRTLCEPLIIKSDFYPPLVCVPFPSGFLPVME